MFPSHVCILTVALTTSPLRAWAISLTVRLGWLVVPLVMPMISTKPVLMLGNHRSSPDDWAAAEARRRALLEAQKAGSKPLGTMHFSVFELQQ